MIFQVSCDVPWCHFIYCASVIIPYRKEVRKTCHKYFVESFSLELCRVGLISLVILTSTSLSLSTQLFYVNHKINIEICCSNLLCVPECPGMCLDYRLNVYRTPGYFPVPVVTSSNFAMSYEKKLLMWPEFSSNRFHGTVSKTETKVLFSPSAGPAHEHVVMGDWSKWILILVRICCLSFSILGHALARSAVSL